MELHLRLKSSDEGSQHMVSLRNKKNYHKLSSNTPYYLELLELLTSKYI